MTLKVLLGLLLLNSAIAADKMVCGDGVNLCGVLTLASGFGPNEYAAVSPYVHGLWPETDSYGTSECIAPSVTTDPTKLAPCYNNGTNDNADQLDFEQHEWEKHGSCAGAKDADDYFEQVCDISTKPLYVMSTSKSSGSDLDGIEKDVVASGYEVFYKDTQYSQLCLSACAGPDSQWKLSPVADFVKNCGGWDSDDSAPSDGGVCVSGQHGPECSSDKDCLGSTDCVRCASSGFCTDAPLS
ncbi:hypothetical protein TrLO_g13249 [Triparma laevis f. longispina]|uniref:Uncharacterized protein n=1 Tax=Triparma laevis f. longispina TaxID=1714387 RepID=A0A9W7E9C5_9STRA|nr:hypothetical protein TrLO_g13249 [Triparma laevis f. longispina]